MDVVIFRKIKNGSSLWSHFFIIHSIKNLPASFHLLSDFNKLRYSRIILIWHNISIQMTGDKARWDTVWIFESEY
ncbi:hypothetical protein, partial [Xenorhabdus bovienii]|uniref:hypothetical protein n=1 Tax=Xenorhabdus bovienii TaxID=40576 RepID=UPI00237CE8EA